MTTGRDLGFPTVLPRSRCNIKTRNGRNHSRVAVGPLMRVLGPEAGGHRRGRQTAFGWRRGARIEALFRGRREYWADH
jgi:hypothetical protein